MRKIEMSKSPSLLFYLILFSFAVFLPCMNAAAGETLRSEKTAAMLEKAAEPVRVVAFGDSITGVYYHTGSRRAWCDMLGEALRKLYPQTEIQMFNAGISGHTSGDGLARIDRDVIAHQPHLVVVMFGMNDCARNDLDAFRKNIEAIVARCRAAGSEVVLCTPNDVFANEPRPRERLAKYAQTVRDVAVELKVPLADCYRAYDDVRRKNNTDWCLLMSETIHPNMNGHKLFAEIMAAAIAGKPVSLADVAPPDDALKFTIKRLRAGKPIKIVAMEPYDKIVPKVLQEKFPGAKIETVVWPAVGRTLAEIESWAEKVRDMKPNLVVTAIPASASPASIDAAAEEDFVKKYCWVLALCFDYAYATFDTVPVLPSVTGSLDETAKNWESLAEQVIRGYDVEYIARPTGSNKTPAEIVGEWIGKRIAAYDKQEGNAK